MKILTFLLILSVNIPALGSGYGLCENYLSSSPVPAPFPLSVVRYSYLRTDTGHSLWFKSSLLYSDTKGPTWSFVPNLYQSELLSNPMGDWRAVHATWSRESVEKSLLEESTKNRALDDLRFVYKVFANEAKARDVFETNFLDSLKTEDLLRDEESLTMWSVRSSDQSPVAVWGLYRKRDASQPTFELIRMAINKNEYFNLKTAMTFVSEHLLSHKITKGTLEMKTDKVGARFYERLGAKSHGEYEPGKFYLTVDIPVFLELFPAQPISNGSKPVSTMSFLDEIIYF